MPHFYSLHFVAYSLRFHTTDVLQAVFLFFFPLNFFVRLLYPYDIVENIAI